MLAIQISTQKKGTFQIWAGKDQIYIHTEGEVNFISPTVPSRPSCVFTSFSINDFIRGYLFLPFPQLISDSCTIKDGVAFAVRLWSPPPQHHTLIEHASVMWSSLSLSVIPSTKHFSIRISHISDVGLPPRPQPSNVTSPMLGPHTYIYTTPSTRIQAPLELLFCFEYNIIDEQWIATKLAQAVRLLCCKKSISSVPKTQLLHIVSFVFARPSKHTTRRGVCAFPPLDEIIHSPYNDTSSLSIIAYHAICTLLSPDFVIRSTEVKTFRKRILTELGPPSGALVKSELVVMFSFSDTILPIFEPETPNYTDIAELMKPYVISFKSFHQLAIPTILSSEGIKHPAPDHCPPPYMLPPILPVSSPIFYSSPPALFFSNSDNHEDIIQHAKSVGYIISFEDDDLVVVGEKQINAFWI